MQLVVEIILMDMDNVINEIRVTWSAFFIQRIIALFIEYSGNSLLSFIIIKFHVEYIIYSRWERHTHHLFMVPVVNPAYKCATLMYAKSDVHFVIHNKRDNINLNSFEFWQVLYPLNIFGWISREWSFS